MFSNITIFTCGRTSDVQTPQQPNRVSAEHIQVKNALEQKISEKMKETLPELNTSNLSFTSNPDQSITISWDTRDTGKDRRWFRTLETTLNTEPLKTEGRFLNSIVILKPQETLQELSANENFGKSMILARKKSLESYFNDTLAEVNDLKGLGHLRKSESFESDMKQAFQSITEHSDSGQDLSKIAEITIKLYTYEGYAYRSPFLEHKDDRAREIVNREKELNLERLLRAERRYIPITAIETQDVKLSAAPDNTQR